MIDLSRFFGRKNKSKKAHLYVRKHYIRWDLYDETSKSTDRQRTQQSIRRHFTLHTRRTKQSNGATDAFMWFEGMRVSKSACKRCSE